MYYTGWGKSCHYYIEGLCRCQWIWLDAGKKSLCFHVNLRKPRESTFLTGFRPIRFLNCIGLHKILNILKCKHGWAHEYFLWYGWNFLNRSILCNTSVDNSQNSKWRHCKMTLPMYYNSAPLTSTGCGNPGGAVGGGTSTPVQWLPRPKHRQPW